MDETVARHYQFPNFLIDVLAIGVYLRVACKEAGRENG
jgi:hypothetical protein